MIPKEILKKVKRIEIQTRGLVNDVFSGEYHSVFKGRGMEFSEVREYQIGDDIRTIDWNVSARTGHPFVKVFEEERELTVMLLIDLSASGDFGTQEHLKRNLITVDKVLADLEHDKLLAREHHNYSVATRCTELQGKYLSMFTDNINQTQEPDPYHGPR